MPTRQTIETEKRQDPGEARVMFFKALVQRAESEKFLQNSVNRWIEDFKNQKGTGNGTQDEILGSISDPALIDLIAEQIYLEVIKEACESKLSAAKTRSETVKERTKQVLCDRFDLPDDEPVKVDISGMQVLRGDREERIEGFKKEIDRFCGADEEELRAFVKKKGEGSLEADLAILLTGDRKGEVIKLCDEIFQATAGDEDFLEKVKNDDDIPKPIRAMAEFVMTERGLQKCLRKMFIEWN